MRGRRIAQTNVIKVLQIKFSSEVAEKKRKLYDVDSFTFRNEVFEE